MQLEEGIVEAMPGEQRGYAASQGIDIGVAHACVEFLHEDSKFPQINECLCSKNVAMWVNNGKNNRC